MGNKSIKQRKMRGVIMWKCPICDNENVEKQRICLSCGFDDSLNAERYPVLMTWRGQPSVNTVRDQYKNANNAEIYLITYRYEIDAGELVNTEEKEIKIVSADELKENEVFWFPQKFMQSGENEELTLNLILKRGEERVRKDLVFRAPSLEETWQLGIKKESRDSVRFYIGNKDCCAKTESLSLTEKNT